MKEVILLMKIKNKREKEINEILGDLAVLEGDKKYREAVQINAEFLKAAVSPGKYFRWLILKAPQLRKKKENILELGDFPIERWQREIHLNYIQVERNKFAGLLKPITKQIISEINKSNKQTFTVLNIGCGGMEIERQVIEELKSKGIKKNIIFIGVELSQTIYKIAFDNLKTLAEDKSIEMKELTELNNHVLEELVKKAKPGQFIVRVINTDALNLRDWLLPGSFDLVYHSMMKHHLNETEKKSLDQLVTYLAPKMIEYDDFYSFPLLILPSLFTWKSPCLLNGTILSLLRDPSKREVLTKGNGWHSKIFRFMGYYLRIYDKSTINSF
jgi:SAM-dependent methyltransferase